MRNLGALFWIGLVLVSGFTTFKVKHAVQDIDDELARVRKHAVAEQQEVRVLTAEWTFLNQPERLAELNRTFLQLGPITARQLQQRIGDLPWRAWASEPDVAVVASLPAATPPAVAAPVPPAPAIAAAVRSAAPVQPVPVQPVPALSAASVRLATATPGSLDALIARIADTR